MLNWSIGISKQRNINSVINVIKATFLKCTEERTAKSYWKSGWKMLYRRFLHDRWETEKWRRGVWVKK